MEKFKIGTVCSGIGSPEMALDNLGIDHEISFACEIDKFARKSYLENFMPNFMVNDMTKQTWEGDHFYSDIFVGGIPCQAFSLAGKRLGELDPRGLLFFDFYRYVKVQQPKYFIIENVKGLLSMDDGRVFQNWKDLLGKSENGIEYFFKHEDSLNYNLHWKVLNTKDYNLPQSRERVFLIGIREDLPNNFVFPKKNNLNLKLKDLLETNVDDKYFVSETMLNGFVSHTEKQKEKGNGFNFAVRDPESIANSITASCGNMGSTDNYVYDVKVVCFDRSDEEKKRRSEYYKKHKRDSGGFKDRELVLKDQDYYDTILANPNHKKEGLICILGYTRDKKGKVIKRHKKQISGTIHTASGFGGNTDQFVYDGFQIRRLTPLECFRLQGFTDDFFYKSKNVNSDTQLYKQAGNTISVTVIQAILKNLLKS